MQDTETPHSGNLSGFIVCQYFYASMESSRSEGLFKKYWTARVIGQHVSGNKSELVAPVKRACKLSIDAEIERREDDRRESIRRERENLKTPDGEMFLHPSCIDK